MCHILLEISVCANKAWTFFRSPVHKYKLNDFLGTIYGKIERLSWLRDRKGSQNCASGTKMHFFHVCLVRIVKVIASEAKH